MKLKKFLFVLLFFFAFLCIIYGDSNVKCFVGFAAGNHAPFVTGDELDCDGSCANLTLNVGSAMSIFFCDSENLCDVFKSQNTCSFINKGLSMCCCENETYCNIKQILKPNSPTADTTTAAPSPLISCFVGFDLINPLASASPSTTTTTTTTTYSPATTHQIIGQYSQCQGDCANISLNAFGHLFLCDPIQLCTTLQMKNSCSLVDRLLLGCCCTEPKCNYFNDTMDTAVSPVISTTESKAEKNLINVLSLLFFIIFFIINT